MTCPKFANVNYEIESEVEQSTDEKGTEGTILIIVANPYGLQIRADKMIAKLLGVSRNRLKQLQQEKLVLIRKNGNELEIEVLQS